MLQVRLRLLFAALGALALGLVLYLVARGPTLLSSAAADLAIIPAFVPAPLTSNLPSALSTYAFALLGLALLPLSRRNAALSCLGWLAASSLLELAQLIPVGAALAHPLSSPLTLGTFDRSDLLFSFLGSLAAFLTAQAALSSRTHRPPSPPSLRCARESAPLQYARTSGLLPRLQPVLHGSAARLAGHSLLAAAFFVTGVATSPPPPRGFLTTDLDNPCPGSTLTLSWTLDEGVGGVVSASDPDAVEPRFEPRRVEASGSTTLTVLANVGFHLAADGESPNVQPSDLQLWVIPDEGMSWPLYNHAECAGSEIAWDPVLVPVGWVDSWAQVDTVEVAPRESDSEDDSYAGAIFVEHEGRQATLQPSASTDAFRGTPFIGAWQLQAAEPVENQCHLPRREREIPEVAIRVRVICPN